MRLLKGLKKSHIISRVMQFTLAITLLVSLVLLWQSSLLQGQQLLDSQTNKMARLLVEQTSYGATPALKTNNKEHLQWLADAQVQDPKVKSVAIYDAHGERLSFAQGISSEALAFDSKLLQQQLASFPPLVETIIDQDEKLGFIEIRLDVEQFVNEIKQAHQLNMDQQQMMLIIAGIIGMLFARALSYKRANYDRHRATLSKSSTNTSNSTD